MCSSACGHRGDPQASLDHASQALRRGDVNLAQQEAKRGYERFHGLSAEWAWKFRLLQAEALAWRGENDQVLALIDSETAAVPDAELTLKRERLEGLAYADMHLFPKAEQRLGEAEELCTKSAYPACVDVALARGELEIERGDYSKAQTALEQALTRAKVRSSTYGMANALLSLSAAALLQEHFDDALDWARAAYQDSSAIGAESVAQVALGNEGWAYYKLGEPEKAFDLFVEAEKRAHKIGATADEVKWLTTAGYVYLDAHDYDKAEQSYQQALDLARQISSQEDIINALMSLALVSEQTGKLDQARDYADKTIALAPPEGNRLDVLYPMLVKGRVAARLRDTAQAEKTFREIELDPKSHMFLKWEAEHSLAQLYEGENKPDLADQEYRAALATYETARSSLKHEESELPFPANASSIYDDYIHLLVSQGKTTDALQLADYSRARTLAEGLGVLLQTGSLNSTNLDPRRTAKQVGGTILFYWLGPKQSYLWAVTPGKINLFSLPPAAEIDESVQRYRKTLVAGRDPLETASPDGSKLFDTLVGPAKQAIPRNSRVVVIPDGSLSNLNFETLLVSEPKLHYWIEDATISNATSIRLLAASQSKLGAGAGKLLLIGDAVPPDAQYGELPKAAVEMQDIEKHFTSTDQKVYDRDHATPAAYLAGHPEQFSYIHFVAHGTASRLSPLDSAVVLSKASVEEDSYKLYARDIIQRPLHAKLVTISTCYGAGARAYTGEGLVGLSWAFLRAGAHNVIGTLWEVSDVSTPGLMDELYDQLKRGQSPEAALRTAKLSLLHSDGVFRKPFYWAPFQLYTGT